MAATKANESITPPDKKLLLPAIRISSQLHSPVPSPPLPLVAPPAAAATATQSRDANPPPLPAPHSLFLSRLLSVGILLKSGRAKLIRRRSASAD